MRELAFAMIGFGFGSLITACAFEFREWWRRRKIRGRWGRNGEKGQ